MVIATFPQTDQTPPPGITYAQLQQERDQAIDRVQYLEGQLTSAVELEGRVFELEEWKRSTTELLATPNTVLSPAQRIAIVSLRLYKERKEEEGNTGHQLFKTKRFAEDIGLGDEGSRKILHQLHDAGAIDLRVHEEWVDKKKKMWSTVECLPQLEKAPATWGIGRDPNGKQCECNAGTLTTVAKHETVATFIRVSTRCGQCHRTHRTKVYDRTITAHRLTSEPVEFQTEAEAMALVDTLKGEQASEPTRVPLDQDVPIPALPSPLLPPASGSVVNQRRTSIEQPEDEPNAPDRGVPWSKGTPPELPSPEPLIPITPAESLLLAIAGPDSSHLELLPTGKDKCTIRKEPVNREHIHAMLAGTYSPGTRLSYPDGMTRALCLDADNAATKQTLIDAACTLSEAGASPLLESSPSIHHPDNVHLWLVFDGLVNARNAWATIEAIVPELRDWRERWPGRGTCIRLPAAYYRRPGAEGWCQLWRPGGMHRTEGAAFSLLLDQQTPACWVTASPPPPEPKPAPRTALPVSGRVYTDGDPILQDARNTTLFKRASGIANRVSGEELTEAVRQVNANCCQPPLPDDEVRRIARSADKYPGSARGSYDG